MRIKPRECTKSFEVGSEIDSSVELSTALLKDYRYVVAVGLPCTGKSRFLNAYEPANNTFTVWNREYIFDMLFVRGERDEKLNTHIARLETDLVPDLLLREKHQVFIDGYNRMPSGRSFYMNLDQGLGKTAALVFDGPEELIIERMCTTAKYYTWKSRQELELEIQHMKETTVWPTLSEGFDDIIYVNTFGMRGREYLKPRLKKIII